MNTILAIAAFVAAITVFEIVQAIVAHAKAKDEIKLIEAKREVAEANLMVEEARKSAAESEKICQELKTKFASTLSTLTEEQLATYNRALEEARRPVVQYVPVPQFYPWNYEPQIWKVWRG